MESWMTVVFLLILLTRSIRQRCHQHPMKTISDGCQNSTILDLHFHGKTGIRQRYLGSILSCYANMRSTVSGWPRTSSFFIFFHVFSQKLVQPPKVGPLFLLMPALVEQVRRRLFGLDYIVWMVVLHGATTGTETASQLECFQKAMLFGCVAAWFVQLGAAHF